MNWYGLSFKNIFRHKRRTFLSCLSIAVVAFVLTLSFGIMLGFQDDFIANIKDMQTGDFSIQNKDYDDLKMFNPLGLLVNYEQVKTLLKDNKDLTCYPRIEFAASLYQDGEMSFISGIAIDTGLELKKARKTFSIAKGVMPIGDKEVAVPVGMAQDKHIKVGDMVTFLTQTAQRDTNAVSYKVTGIAYFSVGASNGSTIIMDIPAAQKLIKTQDVTQVLVRTKTDEQAIFWASKLKQDLKNSPYAVIAWKDTMFAGILAVQNVIINVFSIIFLIMGAAVIVNTTMMAILERRKEIGMMTSLGTKVREVRWLFFLESLWMGIIGSLVGILLGGTLCVVLNHTGFHVGADIANSTGLAVSDAFYPRITFPKVLQVFSYTFIATILVSYYPTGRIAKFNPVDAFKN